MTFSAYDLEERERYVAEAKAASLRDAAFTILYYNQERRKWGPKPKPDPIAPEEVFGSRIPQGFADASWDAERMLRDCFRVGEAFFGYASATETFDDASASFRREHPGFGENSYQRAIDVGIMAAR